MGTASSERRTAVLLCLEHPLYTAVRTPGSRLASQSVRTLLAIVVARRGWCGRCCGRSGVELSFPLVAVISFTPYAALTSPLPVLAALALRRWAVAAVAALAAVALGLAMVPRAVAGPQPEADGPRLVVMTSNLWLGQANADSVLRVAREHDVDVLAVQELRPRLMRAPRRRRRARAVPAPGARARARRGRARACWRAAPWTGARRARTCGSPCPARRRCGSRPCIRARPSTAPPHPPGAARSRRCPTRTRAATCRSSPATSTPRSTIPSSARCSTAATSTPPTRSAQGLKPTWPAPPRQRRALPLTIDHILVDRRVRVERVTIVQIERSDHRAVIAELRLPSAR